MKVGFIGAGKMAEAMIASLVNSKTLLAHEVLACDISDERRRLLKSRYGVNMYSKMSPVVGSVQVLFLAVKPQVLDDVLNEISDSITKSHLVVSIAAGRKISWIEKRIPSARVIRVMPNLPCLVGEGMSVFCLGSRATAKDERTAVKLLSSFGKVLKLPEDQFDAVTALSGSGPAFFVYVLDKMVAAGVRQGLSPEDALLMAEQTMLGTSKLLMEQGEDPKELIADVASGKGTTAAGLAVLEKSTIAAILNKTIKASSDRSEELSAE